MSDKNTPESTEPPAHEEPAPTPPTQVDAVDDTPAPVQPAPVEEPSPPQDEKPERKEPDDEKAHRRKPHFLVTWAIVLLVAGFVDLCTSLTTKGGAQELRASNQRVMSYLHNLQPFQAADDFTARLDGSEYGWCVMNWNAPFNVTVARARIDRQFDQQLDQAKTVATGDSSLPDVENRMQQAWAQQEGQRTPISSIFSQQAAALEDNPQDFDDAVDRALQAKIDALPAHQEQQTMLLGPEIDTLSSLGGASFYSSRRSFYESQLSSDPDFSRILATFQTAILKAGIHYDDSMKRLNFCRMPAFLRGEDTAPLDRPEDNPPNIFAMAIIKAPGLLDAYMNTVRLGLAKSRAQSVIALAALVIGALLLFFSSSNNCLTVVIKLFFVPLAGSLVIGLIWGIAYVITTLFGKILAAPAIDVLGSTMATPFLHWGAGRLMEHHLSEKAIEKYAERKILDK